MFESTGVDPSRLDPDSRLECSICWWVYDPRSGDEAGNIARGTPFAALPDDWHCPQCDALRHQFLVIVDNR
jgi:rubredoxin